MKVVTILGTRPELIKLSSIIKKFDEHLDHVLVHTGQNYDYELNEIFYKDLELRKPDYFLSVAGKSLGETVGNILTKTQEILEKEKPDAVVILGDTNSGMAGYIAKRLKIPFFHLEAGNRCFDDNVPEEINRRILDHIADVNMVYTENSRRYLLAEGVAKERIFIMGSPMREIFNDYLVDIESSDVLERLGLEHPESALSSYFLVNIHRDENTEIKRNLDVLLDTLKEIAQKYEVPVIVSTHPRLKKKLEGLKLPKQIQFLKPFGFFDYVNLQMNATCVISDSGTIAEESSLLGFPAITIRNAVERPEAVDVGSLLITGVNKESILKCLEVVRPPTNAPIDYEVENCSDRVLNVVLSYTPYINKYVWHK